MKERIIGAIVLVVFVVLIVPVFLDGPPESGEIVSERVPLPGQVAEGETRTVVLERDRDEPVPAAVSAAAQETRRSKPAQKDNSVEPVPKPQPETKSEPRPEPQPESRSQPGPDTDTVSSQAPAKPAKQQTAAESKSATGMWAVQLGSFGNQQNAERLAADLRKQGFAAFLSQLSTGSGQLHRVRIGPQKDRESAEAMAARLAKAGHKGQVVPHP